MLVALAGRLDAAQRGGDALRLALLHLDLLVLLDLVVQFHLVDRDVVHLVGLGHLDLVLLGLLLDLHFLDLLLLLLDLDSASMIRVARLDSATLILVAWLDDSIVILMVDATSIKLTTGEFHTGRVEATRDPLELSFVQLLVLSVVAAW